MNETLESNSSLWLKDRALALGFDDAGIASAEITPDADKLRKYISEGKHGPLDYLERTTKKRQNIKALMPNAKSVLLVVKNYYTGDHENFASKDELETGAKVARYAWGRDYHSWFKKRLRKLRKEILEDFGAQREVLIFNDCGPVNERAWARQAGLGFIGKSAMFIHRNWGTWTLLGGLVTDVSFMADKAVSKRLCGTCTACVDSCPTRAICNSGGVDARSCLGTWNIERPNDIGADSPKLLGHGWGLGCDICQEVCPWNKFKKTTTEARFQPQKGQIVLSKDRLPRELCGTALARPKHSGLIKGIRRALHVQQS